MLTVIFSRDLRGQALYSCSFYATPQSVSISWKGVLIRQVPQFLYLVPWFLWLPPWGYSLIALIPWPSLGVPGYHGTIEIRETVCGRLPHPRHCMDRRLKHTPSLSEIRVLLACFGSLAIGAGFRFGTHLVVIEVLSGNIGWGTPSLWSCSASLKLTSISKERAYPLPWNPSFCDCCPGYIYRSPGSVGL